MVKSTYKPAVAAEPPLPEGWTEHKAPTGHAYFYNATTKESTYIRPAVQVSLPPTQPSELYNGFHPQVTSSGHFARPDQFSFGRGNGRANSELRRRHEPADRPKSKTAIPGCEPWVLVRTKLGRRFVHNPEDGESFWKFPPDVMRGVIEYDRLERERRAKGESAPEAEVDGRIASTRDNADATEKYINAASPKLGPPSTGDNAQPLIDSDGEEYEEVEVTDDEDESNPSKRPRVDGEDPDVPVEFNEDDIAYQLAAMGQDYGLEPGEYDDGVEGDDLEEGAEGLELTEEDSSALFMDMLDDHHISPYTPWEKLIEAGQIIEDDRYTVLPNMKARREVFGEWSRKTIQRLKEVRAKEEQKDPRVAYFAFLETKATPKLYWSEFRRKYQKEPEMKSNKLSDKDREKAYREYINRIKLPEQTLKSDLISVLKATPVHTLNRSSTIDALPAALLTDLRYISLRSVVRNPLIEAHISTLPPAPTDLAISPEEETARIKEQRERERRQDALAERQRRVEEEKQKQKSDLYRSKGRLREEEEEIQKAMKVGKEGLLGHMHTEEDP